MSEIKPIFYINDQKCRNADRGKDIGRYIDDARNVKR